VTGVYRYQWERCGRATSGPGILSAAFIVAWMVYDVGKMKGKRIVEEHTHIYVYGIR